jgi:hypothetical protein
VRLDTLSSARDSLYQRIVELPGVMPSVHRYSGWRHTPGDSIELYWSTGYVGVVMRLAGRAEVLSGSAESLFDSRYGTTVPAGAELVECDAPVPAAARPARRFSTALLLESGDTLLLGAPIPIGLSAPAAQGPRIPLESLPTGPPYEGAEALTVDVDSLGLVARVSVHYPDSVRFEELARRMEAELGPPTSASEGTSIVGSVYLQTVGWVDRYHALSVWGPENVRVSLSRHR